MEIFISRNNEKHGPYSLEQIQGFLASGQMQGSDHAWYEGVKGWVPLSQVPGVQMPKAGSVPPPPPPAAPAPVTHVVVNAPKKKSPVLMSCGGCLGLIVAIGAISAVFGPKPGQSPAPTARSAAKPVGKSSAVSSSASSDNDIQEGEIKTVTVNGEKITVAMVDSKLYSISAVEKVSAIKGGFSDTQADGRFLIVRLRVQNASKEPGTVSTSLLKLIDNQDREFTKSDQGQAALGMSGDKTAKLFRGALNPGITQEIPVVFDVPDDAKGFKLKIPAGLFGGGKEALLPVPEAG